MAQIRISSNRLRQIVEDEGQRALKARDKGLIRPGWNALDCKTNASGPTEAFCKTLTARLKGSAMRWDSPNAEGIMALAAMDQSGQWQTYWNLQNAIAA